MQSKIKIGFCGVGNMAGAILSATISSGVVAPDKIFAYDPTTSNLNRFENINYATSNAEVCEKCDLVFLGIKPQMLDVVAKDLKGTLDGKFLVSMLAGVSIIKLQEALGNVNVIRIMPNTPMLVGYGITAIARGENIPNEIYELVCTIFNASGDLVQIKEDEINRIIPISSSSPAFFFRFIKAMIDAAVQSGIDETVAEQLAVSTMHGVSHMMKTSGKTPDELIAQVTSPGGTTLAGLTAFDDGNFEKMISEVFKRCVNRADELGK